MDQDSLKEIPQEFLSASTGQLFDHCIECEKFLLDEGTEYLIEKAVKNYPGYKAQDTIFDYAICMDCAKKMHQKMSAESMAKVQEYFSQNVKQERTINPNDPNSLTEKCLIKETSKNEATEFQVYAHCKGNKLFMGNPPYMISGEAMEEVMDILSKETKDELGGFFDKHFSPDPDLFETKPRLILV